MVRGLYLSDPIYTVTHLSFTSRPDPVFVGVRETGRLPQDIWIVLYNSRPHFSSPQRREFCNRTHITRRNPLNMRNGYIAPPQSTPTNALMDADTDFPLSLRFPSICRSLLSLSYVSLNTTLIFTSSHCIIATALQPPHQASPHP